MQDIVPVSAVGKVAMPIASTIVIGEEIVNHVLCSKIFSNN